MTARSKRKPMTQDDWRVVVDLISSWYRECAGEYRRGVMVRVVGQSSLERYGRKPKGGKR